MDIIEAIYDLAGSLICHQLPERSLTAGNMVLPVCARDTGIYAGILTSYAAIILLRRLRAQKPPGLAAAFVMVLMMVPMMADGALSYAGLIETNNTARLLTGLSFGLPIPFFLVPAANFRIDGENKRPVLKKWYEFAAVCLAGAVLSMMLLYGIVPYIAAGLVFVSGFLMLISRVAYTILVRSGISGRLKLYGLTLLGTAAVLMLMFAYSSYVLQPLRDIFAL